MPGEDKVTFTLPSELPAGVKGDVLQKEHEIHQPIGSKEAFIDGFEVAVFCCGTTEAQALGREELASRAEALYFARKGILIHVEPGAVPVAYGPGMAANPVRIVADANGRYGPKESWDEPK
jgi:hypothetical protein